MTRQRVPNAELYRDTARQNLLTNGGFEIWQRGNGPFTTNAAWTADRWQMFLMGTDTCSLIKGAGENTTSSLQVTFTLGSGAGSSQVQQLLRLTEHQLRGRTLSLSMRVWANTANAVRLAIYADGTGGAATYSSFHPGTSAWALLTVTTTVPVDATLIAVSAYFAASCTALLDSAMLVIGNVAADYAPLHPADDLARCLRYYEQVTKLNGSMIEMCLIHATSSVNGTHYYAVRKAVAPTVTYSAPSSFSVVTGGATENTCNGVSSFENAIDRVWFTASIPGTTLTMGQASKLSAASGQTASITVEANP